MSYLKNVPEYRNELGTSKGLANCNMLIFLACSSKKCMYFMKTYQRKALKFRFSRSFFTNLKPKKGKEINQQSSQ